MQILVCQYKHIRQKAIRVQLPRSTTLETNGAYTLLYSRSHVVLGVFA
jgi:hypothetical protein